MAALGKLCQYKTNCKIAASRLSLEKAGKPDTMGRMVRSTDLPANYPYDWEADLVLRDGSIGHVRPILPEDEDKIHDFHSKQSEQSVYMRFFAPIKRLSDKDVYRFTHVDYVERVALVVFVDEQLIGIGRYDRLDGPESTEAEVAFNISDHFQGRGVGSVLLEHLAAIGEEAGVERFIAEVLPANRKMIGVFLDAGYDVSREFEDGIIRVEFSIEPTDASQAVSLAREQRSESLSVRSSLSPQSVAVIGASRREHSVGTTIVKNLLSGGFTGKIFAINNKVNTVQGLPTYANLSLVGEPIDMAIIAVPAESVLQIVDECGAAQVRTLLVLSSGFAELAGEGTTRQKDLAKKARAYGMRVIGPSSFGLINTRSDIKLNASLARSMPKTGHFGLFSQSGSLAVGVLASAGRRGLGLSDFASAGNRVDVSGNDFMQYWIDDEQTHAVGLYLESIGNPRKFSRIARNLATRKPVVVVKSDVSSFTRTPGHMLRPSTLPAEAFEQLLHQAGVIRANNVHQMFDVAQLVVNQPIPAGKRLAIISNSVAMGVLSGDAALSRNLEVTHGPVNLHALAGAEEYREALEAAFTDENVDSVVVCFSPPLDTHGSEVAAAVAAVAASYEKPCIATFLELQGISEALTYEHDGQESTVPAYPMPEDAIRALAAVTNYGAWRQRGGNHFVTRDVDRRAAHSVIETILESTPEGRELSAKETHKLLSAYGIKVWKLRRVGRAREAILASKELRYPVVVKSVAPQVRNQPLLSVRSDLQSPQAVLEAYRLLRSRLSHLDDPQIVVQKMAHPGIPMKITGAEDPLFGPVISVALAGPSRELLGDVSYRVPPLLQADIAEMVHNLRAYPLLSGNYSTPSIDEEKLHDLLARVSMLADDFPAIKNLELTPVNVHENGVDVLGAKCVLAPPPVRVDQGRRMLPVDREDEAITS